LFESTEKIRLFWKKNNDVEKERRSRKVGYPFSTPSPDLNLLIAEL
jgi:hypothetical protein